MRHEFLDGPPDGGSRLELEALDASNPGALRMYRYKPPGVGANAPLLVILHGCGQSALALDHGAGWSALARCFGFALLAPQQTQANNMGTCFNWFLPGDTARGQGEAQSIHQMVLQTIRDFASDPARIFITGLSAGGAMTSAMLAAYPDVFAGGAIIAGLAYGAASNLQEAMGAMQKPPALSAQDWGDAVRGASVHKGPWPRVSVWHGDADRTVGISNQDAIVAQWRDVHGLTDASRAAPPKETRAATALRRAWQDGSGVTKVEAYRVPGLGHGVPIRPGFGKDEGGAPGPFILDAGISSSLRIAEFFGLTESPEAPAPRAARPAAPANDTAVPQLAPPLEQIAPLRPLKKVIVKALAAAGLIRK